MKKIAIITSLIGAYDSKLLEIDYDRSKYDFICFTNNKKLKSKTWDLRIVEPIIPNDNGKSSYFYKWCMNRVLDHNLYDICCWMDSSVWTFNMNKFEEYLNKFIQMKDCVLYIEHHPSRLFLKEELEANRRLNKDVDERMVNQVNRYFKEGFDDNYFPMVETGFSFKRFKDPDLIKMSEMLFEEMKPENATKRDQLLFNYCVWKTGLKDKIKLFTFEQKSEILQFKDHPHRPFHKDKILLVGPWQGEIGWELFCFQGYLRYISQTEPFDKIVVGCEPENKFIYDDFADQVILTPSNGSKDKWKLSGKDPFFKIQNTQDKDLRMVKPTENLCYNILSNLHNQELIPYNFTKEFREKYPEIDFDEVNEALRTKNIPNYLRKQLNLPLKNEFCFVVVGGKAEKYIERCLNSIKNQTNINWKCVVCLTPFDGDRTYDIAKTFENNKIEVIKTQKDFFVIKNYLKALEILNPHEDSIIINVDADDWLDNDEVLTKLDCEYMQNRNLLLTYGSWKVFPDYINIPSNCFPYNQNDFQKGIRRTLFRATHLRTMKYKVFKNIHESEFKHSQTGEIYKAAGDVAIMLPALESVGIERSKFIPQQLYVYNRENEFNEDKEKKQLSFDVTMDVAKKEIVNVKNFDKYRKISLLDRTFIHGDKIGNYTFKNFDSEIEWDRNNLQRDVIFFTDFTFKEVDRFNNFEKMCLLIEPPVIFPQIYEDIKLINNKFKYVFTHSKKLLDLGQNFKLYPYGSTWIFPKDQKIYDKSKDISIVVSKMNKTDGHKMRHEIVKQLGNYFDLYGKGYNPVDTKLETLKNYKFQIVVENCSINNYFSEKLCDCLLTGTIPIYYGCKNLKNFDFDVSGILDFNSLEELKVILDDIKSGELYYEYFKNQIKHNFEIAKKYSVVENYIYNNYFKDLKV